MIVTSIEQLGTLVRDQRTRLKMSQAQLAEKTGGVTRQWVISLEAGRANPDFVSVLRVLGALRLEANVAQADFAQVSVGKPDLDQVLDRLKQ